MVRQALRYQVLDSSGVPIAGASIQVAQVGTTTNITQTMYAGLTGVTTIANPLITDASGRVQAYFDGTDAVALLRVTMIPTLTGFTFTSRDVQLGSDYGVLNAGDAPLKGTTVDANDRFNMARSTAGDPATLQTGDMWYNTTTNALHWQSDVGTQTVSSTTGDVTDVVAGDGLSGVESPAGVITIDVVAGNAINVDATDVEVDVNAATSAVGALAGDDKILISDTDAANATKSATISQIDPTMLDGTANQVYFSNSTGNVTGLTLGAAGTVLTSAGATSDPTFGTAATVGANKSLYTNNSDVESGVAFGAAGTVLTSGGTDATATPPTWEAAAGGGGSVQMTSSGSITAGNTVALSAANTVKEVTDTRVAMSTNTSALNAAQLIKGAAYSSKMVWDGNSSPTVLATWTEYSGNWYVQAGTYSSETVTWGTRVEINAGVSHWYAGNTAIYDSVNGGYWTWAGRQGSPYTPYVNFNTVSGTTITAGTPVTVANGSSTYYSIAGNFAYDSTNSKMVFIYCPSALCYIAPMTVSGTTITVGTETYPANGNFKNPSIFWNSTYERLVVLGGNNSGNFEVCLRQYDSGTSSYTAQTINTITHLDEPRAYTPPNYMNGTQAFDMGSNQYVQVGIGADQKLRITNFTLTSASTGTMGTTSIFDGTSAVSATGTGVGQDIKLGLNGAWSGSYNIANETLVISARDSDTGVPLKMYTLRYSAATGLWSQAGATLLVTADGSGGTDITYAASGTSTQIVDSGGNHRIIAGLFYATDAAGADVFVYHVATPSSGSTDARDVIGISQDTVGTGVAVNVTVNGGVNENVTGLTSGSDYFIQGDGSLSTTAASPDYGNLGRALATDKLLITGIGDTTVSNQ
mgnify:CR=1 FL=1